LRRLGIDHAEQVGLLQALFNLSLALYKSFFDECCFNLLYVSIEMRSLSFIALSPHQSLLPSLFEFGILLRFHCMKWRQLTLLIIEKFHVGAQGTLQVKI
jgi:hypothetical protein